MKWFRFCSAVVALLSMTAGAQAGILNLSNLNLGGCAKSCGCASDCQPTCCKPTITRPCDVTVHTYQRKCSDIKPPCCNTCDAPNSRCAPSKCCTTKCAPKCAAPAKCAPKCAPKCAAPAKCAPKCAPKCAAPAKCCTTGACGKGGCATDDCCGTKCCPVVDPCEIAQLIYTSQTACYAKDRKDAIDSLGDDYDCQCNPEIMAAFIYALNDSDERVRAEAADEIGDQLRKNPCCCSKELTAALTCALGDCDKKVRRQATEGLEACGYEVVDGCCDTGCDTGCDKCGGHSAPAKGGASPAPAPPAAFAPPRGSKLVPRSGRTNRLADLFGLLD